jgi:hypothetical protein
MTHDPARDAAPDAVLTDPGLKALTDAKRQIHSRDAMHYQELGDRLKAHLGATEITGDKWFSRRVRAWRVARLAHKAAGLSREIAKTNQALYSTFNNQVTRLPERRKEQQEQKALQKSTGGAQINGATIQLNTTAQYLSPTPPTVPIQAAQSSQGIDGWNIYEEFPRQEAL